MPRSGNVSPLARRPPKAGLDGRTVRFGVRRAAAHRLHSASTVAHLDAIGEELAISAPGGVGAAVPNIRSAARLNIVTST
jgi:hypothetical protein